MIAVAMGRPILFSGPMVRAILAGRKTQTRRVIKPQPNLKDRNTLSSELMTEAWQAGFVDVHSPFCLGRRLWVRETWAKTLDPVGAHFVYRADWPKGEGPWKPSIFMPREACRIKLEVEEVRVQRLQEISYEDCQAEGCPPEVGIKREGEPDSSMKPFGPVALMWYAKLWDSINAKRGFGWERDPFVWAINFKRVS